MAGRHKHWGHCYSCPDIREYLFERDGGECWICKDPVDFKGFHLDHLIPRSAVGHIRLRKERDETFDSFMNNMMHGEWWGIESEDNLAVAHPRCNVTRKATRFWFWDPDQEEPELNRAVDRLVDNMVNRLSWINFKYLFRNGKTGEFASNHRWDFTTNTWMLRSETNG